MSLIFTEFETGTFVPALNYIRSKSEISYMSFGNNS